MASDGGVTRIGVRGLSSADAAVRLENDGPNALPTRPRVPVWQRVLTDQACRRPSLASGRRSSGTGPMPLTCHRTAGDAEGDRESRWS